MPKGGLKRRNDRARRILYEILGRIQINYRWLLQAAAFIGCIYAFLQIWERSKRLIVTFDLVEFLLISVFGLLFLICFFLMAVTSYLKQKVNGTLKNPIPLFEKVIARYGLTSLATKKE